MSSTTGSREFDVRTERHLRTRQGPQRIAWLVVGALFLWCGSGSAEPDPSEETDAASEKRSSEGDAAEEETSSEEGAEAGEGSEADDSAETRDGEDDGERGPDAAWMAFDESFEALARGRIEATVTHLVELRRQWPNHPAAVFARPVLRALRDHSALSGEELPDPSAWDDLSNHPAVEDRGSAIYDPEWAKFREAFVALANRQPLESRELLSQLEGGEHPTGSFAEDLLDLMELKAELSSAKADGDTAPRDRRAEPPSVSDRNIAAAFGGTAGLAVGTWLGVQLGLIGSIPNPTTFTVPLGVVSGVTTGAYLGGNLVGSEGALWATGVGSLIGTGVSFLMVVAVPSVSRSVFLPILAAPPVAGGVIGYAASDDVAGVGEATAAGDPVLRPSVAVHPEGEGGRVGLRLQFR